MTDQLKADAMNTVLGVISAREHSSPADASLLIQAFRDDAKEAGVADTDAWAMLFTASTVWAHSLVSCRQVHHKQTFTKAIHELALMTSSV